MRSESSEYVRKTTRFLHKQVESQNSFGEFLWKACTGSLGEKLDESWISSTVFNWSFFLNCSRIVFRIVAIKFGKHVFDNVVYICRTSTRNLSRVGSNLERNKFLGRCQRWVSARISCVCCEAWKDWSGTFRRCLRDCSDLIWVDTGKSVDPTRKNIRSRSCAREYKTKKQGKIHWALPASQLFFAMALLEAVKVLVSIMMSVSLSNKKETNEVETSRHQQNTFPRNTPETQWHQPSRRWLSEAWRKQSWQIDQEHVRKSRRFPHLAFWLRELDLWRVRRFSKRKTQRSIVSQSEWRCGNGSARRRLSVFVRWRWTSTHWQSSQIPIHSERHGNTWIRRFRREKSSVVESCAWSWSWLNCPVFGHWTCTQDTFPQRASQAQKNVHMHILLHVCLAQAWVNCSVISARVKKSAFRSSMSSPCWSLPPLLSHSLPQQKAPLGQRDLLQEHSTHPAQFLHHDILREHPEVHPAQFQTENRVGQNRFKPAFWKRNLEWQHPANKPLHRFWAHLLRRTSLSPTILRPRSSWRFREVFWKTSTNCMMYRENLENKINKPQLRTCLTSRPRCTSTSPLKALRRTLISQMERLKSCWLHNGMPKELPGDGMQQRSFRKER